MVKAVVDVERRILALGGELHSDEEAVLLDDGSSQSHLWGINLYPASAGEDWIDDGIRNLGLLHDVAVAKIEDGAIFTEDMNLLYYYRNRLAGYGLSMLADPSQTSPGAYDRKGFLA